MGVCARCTVGLMARHCSVHTLDDMETGLSWAPITRRPNAVREVALVVAVCAVEIGITAVAAGHQDLGDLGAAGIALLVAGAVVLPLRWRAPVAVLAVTFATTLAYWSLDYPRGPVFVSLIIAFAHAIFTGHRAVAITSLALGFVSFLWLGPALGRGDAPTLAGVLGLAAWLAVLLSVVELIRVRRVRAHEAQRMRDEAMRRLAADERMRIARELHDVVAHNMSLVNLQAGVALHLFDERPEEARNALRAIRDASKEALTETRRVLEVLRSGDEAPLAPMPTLRELDDLVSRASDAGLRVHMEVEGDVTRATRDVELAAYRIIQESLTNVARHSDRRDATVRLRADDAALTVEVLDEGSPHAGERAAPDGSGIVGMRERASSVGGKLEAGPRAGQGFAVRAWLPLAVRS